MWNASRFCVSSLRRGHANLLCIVPILRIQEKSVVIDKEFNLELLNLHVFRPPETEEINFGFMSAHLSVCDTIPQNRNGVSKIKFSIWSFYKNCTFVTNFGRNPSNGNLSACPSMRMWT
ncbi:hypothetical protein AVEN_25841-1 [Araneus ventricosus]|uniref:Uncharacterized protein n=1 Tax=Araneus ventricosus TaxID=182803 RepID=A0A4Y2TJI0_ARAVE|nr:hypothetical protein AVEN_25841-1 [Araneus ventricosus]